MAREAVATVGLSFRSRRWACWQRLTVLASVGRVGLTAGASRVLVLADGVLILDGQPGDVVRAAAGPRLYWLDQPAAAPV